MLALAYSLSQSPSLNVHRFCSFFPYLRNQISAPKKILYFRALLGDHREALQMFNFFLRLKALRLYQQTLEPQVVLGLCLNQMTLLRKDFLMSP